MLTSRILWLPKRSPEPALGCGKAEILDYLRADQYYVGVERHPALILWLTENRAGFEFRGQNLDQDNLVFDRQFDTVLMVAVIEHLKNPDRVLGQIPRWLKPDGRLLITTPSLWGDRIHGLGARVGLFSMYAVREHETIFTHKTLRAIMERNGLRVTYQRNFLLGGNQLFVCEVAQ